MLLGTWSYGKEGLIGTLKLTSSVWIQAEVDTQRGSITVISGPNPTQSRHTIPRRSSDELECVACRYSP